MEKLLTVLFFYFFINYAHANSNLVYLDVQNIIDQSNLGKFYKNEIKKIQDDNKKKLILKEKEIKKKEDEFNNQKNLLSKDELNKKLKEINSMVKEYQLYRNNLNKKIAEDKKKYSVKILSILNPLLTSYVETNNINLVIEKKNVLIGIKSLDITNDILIIFNEETKNISKLNDN